MAAGSGVASHKAGILFDASRTVATASDNHPYNISMLPLIVY